MLVHPFYFTISDITYIESGVNDFKRFTWTSTVLTSTRVSWGVYDRFSLPIVLQWEIVLMEQNAFHGVYFW